MSTASSSTDRRVVPTLADLARIALWLGLIGFGGGISVLATTHELVVRRRRWLTEREFANAATIGQTLPGASAANALAYIGLRFFSSPGAAVAYVAFILPGAIATVLLAWAYVRFGAVPSAANFLDGLNAAVVGVITSITLQLVRTSVVRPWQLAVSAGAVVLSLIGLGPAEVALFGLLTGLISDLGLKRARLERWRRRAKRRPSLPPKLPAMSLGALKLSPATLVLLPLALVFFRAGLGAFGGGFAIVSQLKAVTVGAGWLTQQQFADAVSIGKLTPGPILLMATFMGYLQSGLAGAVVATAAIFAAPFILVVALGAWLMRVRSRRPVRAALRGLTPAVVGLMAAAAISLGRSLHTPLAFGIAGATLFALWKFKVNAAVPMLAGGIVSLAAQLIHL